MTRAIMLLLAVAIAGCGGASSSEPVRLPQRIESSETSGSEGSTRLPVRIEDPDQRWVDPPPVEPPEPSSGVR